MKITRITVWQVPLPLKHPCQLSGGRLKVTPSPDALGAPVATCGDAT